MAFDVRAAKQLQEGECMTIDACPGLRLEVTKTTKSWTYRYRNQAEKLRQVKLGFWPEMGFHEAMVEWGKVRSEREAGIDPAEMRKSQKLAAKEAIKQALAKAEEKNTEYLVSHLVHDYLHGHVYDARKPAGALAAASALNRFLASNQDLANMAAKDVKRQHAFQALESIKSKPTAAQKIRSMMGSAWDYALDSGRLDGDVPNWWRSVMKGRLKSKGKIIAGKHQGQKRRVLSDEEIPTLLAWSIENMYANGRDALILYLMTGVRGGEIFSMRKEHLSETNGVLWWTIPKELTKNARHEHATDLRVPLFGLAREIVKRRMREADDDGVMFYGERGDPYTQRAFSNYVYDLQPYSPKSKRQGRKRGVLPVTDWSPHDLRRTARTQLAALGCPNEVAEAILGHMPPEIEATYNIYTYDNERVQWLQALADKFARLELPPLP